MECSYQQKNKMNRRYSILLFSIILLSCANEKKRGIAFIDYSKTLDSISTLYSKPERGVYPIDLCQLFNKSEWDSIAFVFPYLPIQDLNSINFCNMNDVKDTMEYVVGVEWNFGLLFLKGNCVDSYSVVGGNPSFVEILGRDRPSIPILRRSDCKIHLLNVPSESGPQSIFFMPSDYPTLEDTKELKERMAKPMQPIDSLEL